MFEQLSATRRYSSDGYPLPITHEEIYSWSQLTGEKLAPTELALLRTLDTRKINTLNEFIRDASK